MAVSPPNGFEAIERVRAKNGNGVYASDGLLFKDAIFGRDSIETAEDLLYVTPAIAKEVIVTLSRLQGVNFDSTTEEEPGRIHHEYRRLYIDGRRISSASEHILRQLQAKWGGKKDDLLYYGSVDATPLFVRLVLDYCKAYGSDILQATYTNKSGDPDNVRQALLAAVHWICERVRQSDISLIEFHSSNPRGTPNQVWKDSPTSYIHQNGKLANHAAPVASIEVQGYAYDALTKAADYFADIEDSKIWLELATRIQTNVLSLFWMPRLNYFALGLDRDPKTGRMRQIKTLSSNPALLMNTTIFDNLPKRHRRLFLTGIVKRVYSHEFLTSVGIRCRALRHTNLVKYQDYHGSWAVWTKETFDIAKGLHQQGFNLLAQQLENRLINASIIISGFQEFFYVSPSGKVYYGPPKAHGHIEHEAQVVGASVPENIQAWTVSAILAIEVGNPRPEWANQDKISWALKLDYDLFRFNPTSNIITSDRDLHDAYPVYDYRIYSKRGKLLEKVFNNRLITSLRGHAGYTARRLRLIRD